MVQTNLKILKEKFVKMIISLIIILAVNFGFFGNLASANYNDNSSWLSTDNQSSVLNKEKIISPFEYLEPKDENEVRFIKLLLSKTQKERDRLKIKIQNKNGLNTNNLDKMNKLKLIKEFKSWKAQFGEKFHKFHFPKSKYDNNKIDFLTSTDIEFLRFILSMNETELEQYQEKLQRQSTIGITNINRMNRQMIVSALAEWNYDYYKLKQRPNC